MEIQEYINNIDHDFGNKYAPYYKKMLSGIIDSSIIYLSAYLIMKYLPAEMRNEFYYKYIIHGLFISCLIYQYISYKNMGRTLGEHYLKIKPVFEIDAQNKKRKLFYRAFVKSIVFVPLGMMYISIIVFLLIVLFLIPLLIEKTYRLKKILPWDLISGMVVIEDK